jgi:hypothetical protein
MHQEFLNVKGKNDFISLLDCPISLSLRVRRVLMKIRTCMSKYSSHIAGLKPDSKAQDIPRVSYNELRFDVLLDVQTEAEKV